MAALAAGALLAPGTPRAQNFGLGFNAQDNGKPITIEAEQGIEWQQNNHVYIARGHAKATRGQATVFGDTLIAYYRPVAAATGKSAPTANSGTSADAASTNDAAAPASAPKPNDPTGGGSTEIYRLEADGNVRMATEPRRSTAITRSMTWTRPCWWRRASTSSSRRRAIR